MSVGQAASATRVRPPDPYTLPNSLFESLGGGAAGGPVHLELQLGARQVPAAAHAAGAGGAGAGGDGEDRGGAQGALGGLRREKPGGAGGEAEEGGVAHDGAPGGGADGGARQGEGVHQHGVPPHAGGGGAQEPRAGCVPPSIRQSMQTPPPSRLLPVDLIHSTISLSPPQSGSPRTTRWAGTSRRTTTRTGPPAGGPRARRASSRAPSGGRSRVRCFPFFFGQGWSV